MTRYAVGSLVLLGAVATLAGGCGQVATGRKVPLGTVDGRFEPEASLDALRIINSLGSVDIVAATGSSVEVEAAVKVSGSRSGDFEDGKALRFQDHISVRQEGGELVIEDVHRSDPDQNDWQLDLTIRVPGQVRIQARSGAGNIAVDLAAAGDLDVDLGAGNVEIRLQTIDGGVKGRVGAGNFALRTTESSPTKDVEIDCAAGNITLSLPEQFAGDFDATAAIGEVSVSERYGLEAQRKLMAAYVRGSVGTGGPRYKLHAATGTIRLQ